MWDLGLNEAHEMGKEAVWREVARRAGGGLLGRSLAVGLPVTGAVMLNPLSGVRSPLQEGMGLIGCIRVSHPLPLLSPTLLSPWCWAVPGLPTVKVSWKGKGTQRNPFSGKAAPSPELSSVSSLGFLLPLSSWSSLIRPGLSSDLLPISTAASSRWP